MGGGDLNLKKSWHPLTMRNQEKIWKLEQKASEEEKKTQMLRKELEQEKQIQELQKLQEQAGVVKKRTERMDWMYAGAASGLSSLQEDFLLGKRKVDELLVSNNAASETISPAMNALLGPDKGINTSTRELEAKLREDPFFTIKKKEQETLLKLAQNPLCLKRIKHSSRQGSGWSCQTFSSSILQSPSSTSRASTRDGSTSRDSNTGRDSSTGRDYHRSNKSSSQRPSSRTLSHEEKQKRLEQMKQDAQANESFRTGRVSQDKKEHAKELKDFYEGYSTEKDFLSQVQGNAFSTKSDLDLSKRLDSKRHYLNNKSDRI